MTRVAVVGGGFAGLASALRLAKLGHQVTLVSPDLGGALTPYEADGFSWDLASHTLLPAVTRDLFRKSGRPLERELDLEPVDVIREHRWRDGTVLRLTGGSRASQLAELGQAWVDHVAPYGEIWEATRQHLFENRSAMLPRDLERTLNARTSLHRRIRHDLRDKHLREVARYPFELAGHTLRDVPAWAGLSAYLEQRFGAWRPVGGMGALREALVGRLATRKVEVVAGSVEDVVVHDGRAVGVTVGGERIEADAVVVTIDPRALPTLAPLARETMPSIPPTVVYLGLSADVPELTHDVVLHGDPLVTVRPGGRAPDGAVAWTLLVRGAIAEEIDLVLWRHGIKIKPEQILTQHTVSPAEVVARFHGSPLGVTWRGRATLGDRVGPLTPYQGLYAAGAASISGDGLPFAGMSAALVAAAIGQP
ncbi:NAD(P)/FAD-dependent oxidoreductase [Nocardioides sp.]|uniref:phytoene desaturase family protein n=1 Tax=Nocardioides sp. TaxID=35761 RepID=UPI00262A24F5|nr:NAD(P)/FAD-dependent oxidoreductase [Nocardioides sp.]